MFSTVRRKMPATTVHNPGRDSRHPPGTAFSAYGADGSQAVRGCRQCPPADIHCQVGAAMRRDRPRVGSSKLNAPRPAWDFGLTSDHLSERGTCPIENRPKDPGDFGPRHCHCERSMAVSLRQPEFLQQTTRTTTRLPRRFVPRYDNRKALVAALEQHRVDGTSDRDSLLPAEACPRLSQEGAARLLRSVFPPSGSEPIQPFRAGQRLRLVGAGCTGAGRDDDIQVAEVGGAGGNPGQRDGARRRAIERDGNDMVGTAVRAGVGGGI